LFSERVLVNSGDPFTLSVTAGETLSDSELVTRVLVEGYEVVEKHNAEMLKEHGNLFAVLSVPELLTYAAADEEALRAIQEAVAFSRRYPLTGACDPRVEPGDEIEAALPSGTRTLLVDKVMVNMSLRENEAVFDMALDAREKWLAG
jgi:hypothetical protein